MDAPLASTRPAPASQASPLLGIVLLVSAWYGLAQAGGQRYHDLSLTPELSGMASLGIVASRPACAPNLGSERGFGWDKGCHFPSTFYAL